MKISEQIFNYLPDAQGCCGCCLFHTLALRTLKARPFSAEE